MEPQNEPQSGAGFLEAAQQQDSAVAITSSSAQAQIQASMVIAKKFARDQNASFTRILKACERTSLAEVSRYRFPRGGKSVTGPSIRLAEVLAQQWGNIQYGLLESGRSGKSSTMIAYCHDLETNTRVEQSFQVRHFRDTQGGGHDLTDERDIYEITANMGSRRLRACILRIIPPDVVDAALAKCATTLEKGDGRSMEDRVREMILAFDSFGVSIQMIEGRLGHKLSAIAADELVILREIYQSLRDGMSARTDWFSLQSSSTSAQNEPPAEPTSLKGTIRKPEPTEQPAEASEQQQQQHDDVAAAIRKSMEQQPAEEQPAEPQEREEMPSSREEDIMCIKDKRDSEGIHHSSLDAELRKLGYLKPGQTLAQITAENASTVAEKIDEIVGGILS